MYFGMYHRKSYLICGKKRLKEFPKYVHMRYNKRTQLIRNLPPIFTRLCFHVANVQCTSPSKYRQALSTMLNAL